MPVASPVIPATSTIQGRIVILMPIAWSMPWTGNGVNVSQRW